MARISVIGSGFSGLSAACFAAQAGHEVTVFEKNNMLGGRARFFHDNGFLFDMGPSWYWMPDIFEKFFSSFGKSPQDYYQLVKLDPGFQIFFGNGEALKVPAGLDQLYELFESIEPKSSGKLKLFLKEGEFKYRLGMQQLVYKPALSWKEYMNYGVLRGMAGAHVFKSVHTYVRSYFKDPRLVALMEFPVLFLGAMPKNIPALYSLMNYSALVQGTYYPMGGMYKIVSAMQQVASELGVQFMPNCEISAIETYGETATALTTRHGSFNTDAVIASSDYHHTEQKLLKGDERNYNDKYWQSKVFAPSCLIFFIGVNKKIKNLLHHNLFFDTDFETHSKEIYEDPKWPADPLFYVCCPSKTDPAVAPEGMENLFVLVPIAPGLSDSEEQRQAYFNGLIARIEKQCGDTFSGNIIYKKSYCIRDFERDYNAFKGNAYGLANTLMQTAVLKPSLQNKKIKNIIYTGQLTVPGPGVPPALISGQLAAELMNKHFKKHKHETVI